MFKGSWMKGITHKPFLWISPYFANHVSHQSNSTEDIFSITYFCSCFGGGGLKESAFGFYRMQLFDLKG